MNNAKKQRETIECERLAISSRKLELSMNTNKKKKIGVIKRIFHAKMGKIKDRQSKTLQKQK